ncbi:hypothetical protein B484DRAFT_406024 [Ochromonadaceae sp. CCMP2298]|nr:hypothetical protein B484DRAFT_406024 [Ochromonadaceae sp. CCMP2298]
MNRHPEVVEAAEPHRLKEREHAKELQEAIKRYSVLPDTTAVDWQIEAEKDETVVKLAREMASLWVVLVKAKLKARGEILDSARVLLCTVATAARTVQDEELTGGYGEAVERDRSVDSVMEQYVNTVRPMHQLYVEPSKRGADIIVPAGQGIQMVALDMCVSRLREIINFYQ